MGGNQRPYLVLSIDNLESIFEERRTDGIVLRQLDHELGFRKTSRARNLHAQVQSALLRIQSSIPVAPGPVISRPLMPDGAEARSLPVSESVSVPRSQASSAITPPNGRGAQALSSRVANSDVEPGDILGAWTALEALSPQTYRQPQSLVGDDRGRVAWLDDRPVPWSLGERSRKDYILYYEIVLGSVRMENAALQLARAYGDDDEERSAGIRELAVIATAMVNKHGQIVEAEGIAVSSFAWALPLALDQRLRELAAWPSAERQLQTDLAERLRRFDADNQPIPLNFETIKAASRWLIERLGLPPEMVEPPRFVLRHFQYFKKNEPPASLLLGSFYFKDLAAARQVIAEGKSPGGLEAFLGKRPPKEPIDLLAQREELEDAVAPSRFPIARWPSPGGHPLVLLQQAAVNCVRKSLQHSGLVSVNGPPGTGKTTLLRDLIAACVVDRAEAMCAFDEPVKAFTASGEKFAVGNGSFFHLYRLDPSLKGHEVLIASSNNRAVENVSRELPAIKAVTSGFPNYFKSISDALHQDETWGLIAAVLGNQANRSAFVDAFWWDDDRSLRQYLNAAKGQNVVREERDPQTDQLKRRWTPSVVLEEAPPSPEVAVGRWRKCRREFQNLALEIRRDIAQLEKTRKDCIVLAAVQSNLSVAETEQRALESQRSVLEETAATREADLNRVRQAYTPLAARLADHDQRRPFVLWRLLNTARWRDWVGLRVQFKAEVDKAEVQLAEAQKRFNLAEAEVQRLRQDLQSCAGRVQQLRDQERQLTASIASARLRLGSRLVDRQFFESSHADWNLAAPWLPDELQQKRDRLFAMALAVHRSFIDRAAQKVQHNLAFLMNQLSKGAPQDPAKRALYGEVWSTLFLVVPVISTTFASVGRMLDGLPSESFGWLLIDEAGQALPQAAVGAILRSTRTVVVGDPLQIPPVVSLPDRLINEIFRFFALSPQIWAAPLASAQTIADQASAFQATFESDIGSRRVGLPLLVHRRCRQPMFQIFNRIAYGGQMVLARELGGEPPYASPLGPSAWFEVDGEADGKWCDAEGELLVLLLHRLRGAARVNPAIYNFFVITPFRMVAAKLKERLGRESSLFSETTELEQWVNNRVGTIHTVQGREADIVFLVLGAPGPAQGGARQWATATPNILNVAISRARHYFYVLGSRGAWSGHGFARELRGIPSARP